MTARKGVPAGDLPTGLGAPATRALTAAGLTSLEQVARLSQRGLLDLHGVGPKAVRLLSEALAGVGLSLRPES